MATPITLYPGNTFVEPWYVNATTLPPSPISPVSFANLVTETIVYALTSFAWANPSLLVFIKSFFKSSVKAWAIQCNIPSICPYSVCNSSNKVFTASSFEASNSYAFEPLNSDINSSILALFSSPINVKINFAPCS